MKTIKIIQRLTITIAVGLLVVGTGVFTIVLLFEMSWIAAMAMFTLFLTSLGLAAVVIEMRNDNSL